MTTAHWLKPTQWHKDLHTEPLTVAQERQLTLLGADWSQLERFFGSKPCYSLIVWNWSDLCAPQQTVIELML